MGENQAAEQSLRRALERNAAEDTAHLQLGLLLRDREPREAAEHILEALRLEPRHGRDGAFRELGLAFLAAGDYEEGGAALRAAIAANPSDAGAHACLGLALWNQGDLVEALDEFRAAARCDPSAGVFWIHVGQVAAALGQHDEADAAFREGLRLEPQNAV